MGNTYECERIFKKSTNRFLRCVFCRPCVVPEPIYSHFVGFIGTGLISLSSLTFVGLDKSLTYAAKPTIVFPSLGHLCGYLFKKRDRLLENCVCVCVFVGGGGGGGGRFLFVIVANILIIT